MNAAYWDVRWGSRFKVMMLDLVGKLQRNPTEFKRFVLQQRQQWYSRPSIVTPKAGEFARDRGSELASADSACASEL